MTHGFKATAEMASGHVTCALPVQSYQHIRPPIQLHRPHSEFARNITLRFARIFCCPKQWVLNYYMQGILFTVSPCIFDTLDLICTNQCTFYTQMYQSFKYTSKSLKGLYDSRQHVSISYEIIFREILILFLVEVTEIKNY